MEVLPIQENNVQSSNFGLRKKVIALVMTILVMVGFAGAATSTTHATGSVGDLDIAIGDDGKMTVSGTSGMTNSGSSGSAWTEFIKKYRNFIVGVSGIGAVSMILFFIMNLLKLGASSANPAERSKVLGGLIWSGIAAAGLGSVAIIVGFFYSAFK